MKIFKRIVYALLILSIVIFPLAIIYDVPIIGMSAFITFGITIFICLFVFNKKIDIPFLILIGAFLTGLIFKRLHWPGAGPLIVLSTGFSVIGFLMLSVRSFFIIKQNRLLLSLVFVCSIILAFINAQLLFTMMRWPGAGFFGYKAIIPYLIASLFIIISIPNSNFIDWSKEHKRILLRAIFVPWLFMFVITSMQILLPEGVYTNIFSENTSEENWKMVDYEIPSREGLK
ncbi:MAG: hypothetical protein COC01_07685 [Bacteroidetes bacterium]|nr:hypothetical protein [Bacteroidia bacterium]PCH66593.1 MAG: hypothetical protein COC01_07685 [Bacteroidota bacterium]